MTRTPWRGFALLAVLLGLWGADSARGQGDASPQAPPPPPAAPRPAAPPSPAVAPPSFPAAWRGRWTGDSRLVGPTGTRMTFRMELEIEPTETPGRWTWTVTYDGEAGRQVRPYFLVEKDPAKGTFEIDEGNGIVLAAQLLDGALYGQFAVGTSRITTRDRLEGAGTGDERLEVELLTTIEDQVSLSGGKDGVPAVRSWPVRSLQTATLRRATPAPAGTPR